LTSTLSAEEAAAAAEDSKLYRQEAPKISKVVLQTPVREAAQYIYQTPDQWMQSYGIVDPVDRTDALNVLHIPASALALSPASAATAPDHAFIAQQALTAASHKGFFKLGSEIRSQIYFEILRPDCQGRRCNLHHKCVSDFEGCTNVLVLSSLTYQEAIEVLHVQEHVLEGSPDNLTFFRNIRDHPKPSSFRVQRDWTPYLGTKFCELHFLRFRKVALSILLPQPYRVDAYPSYSDQMIRFEQKMDIFTAALKKAHDLRRLRFVIERTYEPSYGYDIPGFKSAQRTVGLIPPADTDNWLKKILRPVLTAAVSQGVQVSAEEACLSWRSSRYKEPYGDPIVDWVNSFMPTSLKFSPPFRYHINPFQLVSDELGNRQTILSISTRKSKIYEKFEELIDLETKRLGEVYGNIGPNPVKYQLIPECRTCFSSFASWEDLKLHLDKFPKHQRTYKPKPLNIIKRHGPGRGHVMCFTCGYTPATMSGLHYHFGNRQGHKRWGILPRWKEDNDEWNEKSMRLWKKWNGDWDPAWINHN
jgi:hypothetical protein